jgi:hypothetical protein
MNKTLAIGTLAAVMTAGSLSPARADGAASTRNILLSTAAAASLFVTNLTHKKRAKQEQQREQARRQVEYRDYYFKKYGSYPTDSQLRDWYYRTYGVEPA